LTASWAGIRAAEPGPPWREAPAYVGLFAPAGPRAAAYQTFVASLDLDAALTRVTSDPSAVRSRGAWEARPELPLDAFGRTGRYDRSKLARLYGARPAMVARGPKAEGGRIVETWTLVSPHPDPTLTRLEPGTLLIILKVSGLPFP
jgi:hypothetical protein